MLRCCVLGHGLWHACIELPVLDPAFLIKLHPAQNAPFSHLVHGNGVLEVGIKQLAEHSTRCKLLKPEIYNTTDHGWEGALTGGACYL